MDTYVKDGVVHSKYNLNEATFLLIADLQREAFDLSNKGKNSDGAFERWQSIKLLLEPRFNKEEIEKLDLIESKFYNQVKIKYPIHLKTENEKRKYNYDAYRIIKRIRLNGYVKYLMILMRLYKIGTTDLEKKHKLN